MRRGKYFTYFKYEWERDSNFFVQFLRFSRNKMKTVGFECTPSDKDWILSLSLYYLAKSADILKKNSKSQSNEKIKVRAATMKPSIPSLGTFIPIDVDKKNARLLTFATRR